MVTDGSGGAIVLWNDDRTGPTRIYAQRINGDGVLQWNRRFDLFSQRVDATGARSWDPLGVPVCADSGDRVVAGAHCMASDGAGGAVLVFVDDVRVGFYAQHLDVTGSRLWNDDGTLIPTIGGGTDVVTDGEGGMWVATSDGRNGGYNVWVEHLNSSGYIVSVPGGIQVSNATNEQAIGDRFNSAASDGAGGVIVTWVDTRNGVDRDVFAQRVLGSGALDSNWPVNGTPYAPLPASRSIPPSSPTVTGRDHRLVRSEKRGHLVRYLCSARQRLPAIS